MTAPTAARTDAGREPDPAAISTPSQFAAALTALRLQAGLSIRELARATGIPSATLGGYCSGRHLPPATQPQQLPTILAALGVDEPATVAGWREALLRVRRVGGRPAAEAAGPGSATAAGESPYRGLEPFTEHQAALFFGRERVVDELAARVQALLGTPAAARMLVVVGPSGSGKSSVLRAGLVPRMRGAQPPWAVAVLVPGTDPVVALEAALGEVTAGPEAPLLVVVDQAEELFSPAMPPERRAAFLEAIVALGTIGRAGTPAVVVLGLRADFYGQAALEPALLPVLQTGQLLLGAMTDDELRRAIVEPAAAANVAVEPALVDLLLRDLAPRAQGARSDAGALPLVSHAMLAAWQRHRGDRLTVGDYVAAGGIAGAIQQTAEQLVNGLDDTGLAAAQWLFGQLVLVDDEGVMTRRRLRHDDLHHPDRAADLALDGVIETFVAGRLLTAGDTTLEISHEALLTAWPRLHDWVLRDLDVLRLQRRIGEAAAVWRERDHDPAALLRGGQLADAQALAEQPWTSHRVLSTSDQQYVAASVARAEAERAAERRRTNRLRALLAGMTALALLAGSLAGVALWARNDARTQERVAAAARDEALSRQLAIAANDLRAKDPALAAQLSLAAYRASPTVQARSSLLDSTAVPTPIRLVGPPGEMHAVASADGALLAVSGSDGRTRLWQRDVAAASPGLRLVGTTPAPADPTSIYGSALSPDGSLLAVGAADGVLTLWDVSEPSDPVQRQVAGTGGASIQSVAFSGDGEQLAAATSQPSVLRWAVGAGDAPLTALPAITEGFDGMVKSVAYRPDGSVLATGSADGMVRLWSTEGSGSARLLSEATVGAPTNFVHAVAFSPDGRTLASAEKDRRVRLWDVADPRAPQQRGEPFGEFTSWVNTVGFSPDGATVAAGSSDGRIAGFSVADSSARWTLPAPAAVTVTQFVGDEGLLTAGIDGVGRVWPLPQPMAGPFADSVWSLLQGGEGAVLGVAPGSGDGAVHLFARADNGATDLGPVLRPPAEAGSADGAAAMSPDGRWVAAGTSTGRLAVWERTSAAAEPQLAGVVRVSDELVESAAISADGALVAAVADDGAVGVWALRPGAAPQPAHELTVPALPLVVAFSPDGATLAVGTTAGQVHRWALGSGEARELAPLTGFENYVYALAFDPSGRYLAAGSTDRTVRIWDMADPAAPAPVGPPLRGPGDTVYALSWGRTNPILAGASKDGGLWMWDVADPADPQLRATLRANGGALYSLMLAADGQRVSGAGTTAGVSTWQVDADAVAGSVCARTGSPMTQEEWQQLAPGVAFTPPCGGEG